MSRLRVILILLLLLGAACSSQDPPETEEETALEEAPTQQLAEEFQDDGRTVADRIQDASTRAKVQLAIHENNVLNTAAIEVAVNGGEVLLTGDVASRAHRQQAAEIVSDVEGTRSVINRIRVDGQLVAQQTEETEEEPVLAEATPPQQNEPEQQNEPAPETTAQPEPEPPPAEPEEIYHTVQSGESLWLIAREYDTSVSAIRQLNGLSGNRLMPGQELRVR